MAVLLPLAALVVRGHRARRQGVARPSGSTAGTSSTGRTWTEGSGYGAVGAHRRSGPPQGAQYGALADHLGHPRVLADRHSSSPCRSRSGPPSPSPSASRAGSRGRSGFTIEILAGIPSVVIGLWGILTFGPFLAHHVYPIIADHVPNVPVLRYFRNPVGIGEGLLPAGIVLGADDRAHHRLDHPRPLHAGAAAPQGGGAALGMTDWEVASRVTLPWVRSGIIGATVLGLGRALGETIAVAMIGGAILRIPTNDLLAVHHHSRHHPDPARRRLHRRHGVRRGHAGRAGPRPRRDLGRWSTWPRGSSSAARAASVRPVGGG